MKIGRTCAAALAGALALGLGACSSSNDGGGGSAAPSSSSPSYTIGIANFTLDGPYFNGMDKAIKAEAKDKGVKTISTDAGGDAGKLASNVEDLLTKEVDAVIISGGPLESAPAVLNSLKAADVPVILVDRRFQTGEYTSWIGPDNKQIGVQNGEFLAKTLTNGGKVGIIKGGPADNSIGLARTNGVKSALTKNSKFSIVEAPNFGNWSSDGGLSVMENMLASNKDLSAVVCENDAMCLGAQRAIENAGLSDKVVLVGADGQHEALQAIAKGTSYGATGLNDANQIGRMGLDRALDVLGGKKVEKDTVVPSPVITKANAQEYLNKGTF